MVISQMPPSDLAEAQSVYLGLSADPPAWMISQLVATKYLQRQDLSLPSKAFINFQYPMSARASKQKLGNLSQIFGL
jgi:hypothetical protein